MSDHFDGSKFHNLEGPPAPTFGDRLRLPLSLDFQKWSEAPFTERKLNTNVDLSENQVAITFVNHATLLIQIKGYNILTDPVWAERVSPFTFAGPKRKRPPGMELSELPRIDLILVSHNHYDHMDLATLKELNRKHKPKVICTLGNKALLQANGIADVEEFDWWDSKVISDDLKIETVPAHHFSGRGVLDQNKTLWAGFVVTFRGHRLLFAGDTAYAPFFKSIREKIGAMDISLLPIGAYEPRDFMRLVHMNPEDAVLAHQDLESKLSISIHFGTFQLTNESREQPVIDLEVALKKLNVSPDAFLVLPEGQTRIFELDFKR